METYVTPENVYGGRNLKKFSKMICLKLLQLLFTLRINPCSAPVF